MTMQAKIKFNPSAKDQARTLFAALKQSFTPSMLNVVLEEIDYVPNPVRSMNLVFQDLKSSSQSNQIELILLDWKPCSGEASLIKIQGGILLCNLATTEPSCLSPEKIFQEFTNLTFSIKAKDFAKNTFYTVDSLDELKGFLLATQKAVTSFPRIDNPKEQGFQKFLLIDQNYEVWVQITEFKRINIPLRRGWERALFLFILENTNGFSFTDFKTQNDSKELAKYYALTKPNCEETDIQQEIIFRIKNKQFGDFFSPHFSRIRNGVNKAFGNHPEVLEILTIPKRGPVKNIHWDRNAISWG